MIPITLNLNADRGTRKTFKMAMVRDQLFTPLLAYLSVLNTLTSYERENGIASYAVHGSALIKNHAPLAFEDLFSGDQPSVGAAASVVTPINVLLRNSFEDVEIDALTLDIQASEQARSATLERVWLDGTRVKPGSTVNIKVLLRSYRGEEIMKSLPLQVPANARGSLSVMVSDGVRLSQWESRELQVQPLQTRGVPQLLQVLNSARRNNRLYVRLITRDGGAIVKGESLAALPPSVLAVMESDRSGGSFRPLQSAVLGEWEIPPTWRSPARARSHYRSRIEVHVHAQHQLAATLLGCAAVAVAVGAASPSFWQTATEADFLRGEVRTSPSTRSDA
jgi:hypothetical protein